MAKPKKISKKKAAPKKKKALKRTASRSASSARTASAPAAPAPASIGCVCVKFGQFYYCMVQKPDGSFERCPTQTRFKTLQQCQQNVCSS
ncbi:hypothetical protein [Lacibacter sediminis]|uniref:Uncharacterized protein n=1 Tax=Lacibacter sediminis TaxID=2760713 RepID=A0A7G5XJ04_9BACT|nr:hypothetical protein [Lacibacter sediminis]QNA45457.1 hypothetical protein H4075_04445 [Lacibacter sediminis]